MDTYNKYSFQVIVYKHNILELIYALAKLFLYGNEDDNLRLNEWTKIAIQRHILMQCGTCAVSCFKLLQSLGVKARVVGLQEKYGRLGHVINEVYLEGKWILVDFINKLFFVDKNLRKICLFDVIDNNGFTDFDIKFFDNTQNISNNSGKLYEVSTKGIFYNESFMLDFLRYGNNFKELWFDKFQLFMSSEDPVYRMYYLLQDDCRFKYSDFYSRGYHVPLRKEEFIAKFYK